MNLALQKRHEQLERWRQNEALNVELDAEKQQMKHGLRDQQSDSENISAKYNNPVHTRSASFSPSWGNPPRTPLNDIASIGSKNINGSFESLRNGNKKSSLKQAQVKFTNSTLFLSACVVGDANECERLLQDERVDINVTTSDGLTGLHEAAICGSLHLVEFLLDHGANIDCCDNEGWTPLHAAASLGQSKIVEVLLERGADATIINNENLLAYDLARTDSVRHLICDKMQEFDIDYLRSQEERMIQSDIEKCIDTGRYEERSHPITQATVLHVMAAKGYISLMKCLLETSTLKKQINLEATDSEGFTPLLAASFWDQGQIVELLIEHGANIFAQAHNGYKISSIVSICLVARQKNKCEIASVLTIDRLTRDIFEAFTLRRVESATVRHCDSF